MAQPPRILLLLLGLAWTSATFAQMPSPFEPYESDVLSARPTRWYLGAMVNAGWYSHGGSFSPNCVCDFRDGTGISFTPGLEALVVFPKRQWGLRLALSYTNVSHDFSYDQKRLTDFDKEPVPIEVDFRRSSSVDYSFLTVQPAFVYYPVKSDLALWAGLDFRIPLKAEYDNREEVLTPGVEYYDGQRTHVLLSPTDIPDGTRLGVGLGLGASFGITLTNRLQLAPAVHWTLPLTPVSSRDTSWKTTLVYAGLLIRFRVS